MDWSEAGVRLAWGWGRAGVGPWWGWGKAEVGLGWDWGGLGVRVGPEFCRIAYAEVAREPGERLLAARSLIFVHLNEHLYKEYVAYSIT